MIILFISCTFDGICSHPGRGEKGEDGMGLRHIKKVFLKESAALLAVMMLIGLPLTVYADEIEIGPGGRLPDEVTQTSQSDEIVKVIENGEVTEERENREIVEVIGDDGESGNIVQESDVRAFYTIYRYGSGWTDDAEDNTYLPAGDSSYVTALCVRLTGQPGGMSGTVAYQVNLSGYGWLEEVENYETAGSSETESPLEAIRVKLTGELAENYDIYYSVYQDGEWTELVSNGEAAGIEGAGKRVKGVRIAVTVKGGYPEEGKTLGRRIDPTKPMVALTFDDGPSIYTAQILDVLEAYDSRATFFMVGNRIASYPDTVRRMVEMGNEPGSHTWGHDYITNLSSSSLISNLTKVDDALQSVAGVRTTIMRPPGGFIDSTRKGYLASYGVPAILWSIDTRDWSTKNTQSTINSVLGSVRDGDIVLMHDLYSATAAAAATIIPELVNRGYQLVTVSELASYRGGMVPGGSYSSFRP